MDIDFKTKKEMWKCYFYHGDTYAEIADKFNVTVHQANQAIKSLSEKLNNRQAKKREKGRIKKRS